MTRRYPLVLPDLGMGNSEVLCSSWFVRTGASVTAGDRLVEILAGSATIDLPAPATGTLVERLVEEDEALSIGQVLAIVESEASDE